MTQIKRYLLDFIKEDLKKRMVFIGGPRQVGKTTLSLQLVGASDKTHPAYVNWDFIKDKKNIVISGATSSGKTTFLNSCIGQIPSHERLITLEDTYEIDVSHQNLVRLKSLKKSGNQTATVTMQDLVQASLRLRPDRIIMGEIRGREIFDFVSACSTGHSGALATIHANNPRVAFMRMAQLYKLNKVSGMSDADIHRELHEVIDIVVQLQKTNEGRRLVEVYYKES